MDASYFLGRSTLTVLGWKYMSLYVSILIDLCNGEAKGACEYFQKRISILFTASYANIYGGVGMNMYYCSSIYQIMVHSKVYFI